MKTVMKVSTLLLLLLSYVAPADEPKLEFGIVLEEYDFTDDNLRDVSNDDFDEKVEALDLEEVAASRPLLDSDGIEVTQCVVFVGAPSSDSPVTYLKIPWGIAAEILKVLPDQLDYFEAELKIEFRTSENSEPQEIRMPRGRKFRWAKQWESGRRVNFRFDEDIIDLVDMKVHILLQGHTKNGNTTELYDLLLDLTDYVSDIAGKKSVTRK